MSCGNCCPDQTRPILSDEFCGNFKLDCGNGASDDRFVWRSRVGPSHTVPAPVAGTVTVLYQDGCDNELLVNLRLGGDNGAIVGTLTIPKQPGPGGNAQSITLQQFDTLEIICAHPGTGDSDCVGTYCLNIHYPSPFSL